MAIVNMLSLEQGEKVTAVFPMSEFNANADLVCVTRRGVIKKTSMQAYANIRQSGLKALNLREDDELVAVLQTDGAQKIIVCTKKAMCIVFDESDVREMGRVSTGVRAINLSADDAVIGADVLSEGKQVLVISQNGYGKRTDAEEYRVQSRGGKGVRTLKRTEKTGDLAGMLVVDGSEDIMLISDAGIIIRMAAAEISVIGRDTQGVRLMRIGEDTHVISVEKIVETEEDGEEL